MEIKRYELDNAFQTFALAGSGIVIGPPGVGKTHLLRNACTDFEKEGIPFLYLPVDKFSGDNASDIEKELGLNCSIVDYLQAQITSEYKGPGILLIDAFDAARSDKNRRYYLDLIYQVRNGLEGAWNVIVSVRRTMPGDQSFSWNSSRPILKMHQRIRCQTSLADISRYLNSLRVNCKRR